MGKSNRERITDLQSVFEDLETKFESVDSKLEENKDYLDKIEEHESEAANFAEESEENSKTIEELKDDIEDSRDEIEDIEQTLDELLTSTEVKKDEIDKFFTMVFGEENEDGNRTGGLNKRLDTKEEEIDQYMEDQKDRFENTYEKIESLLPGAASVGLTKAFADQKQRYIRPQIVFVSIFIIGIVGFVLTAVWALDDPSSVEAAASNVIARIPFFIAFAWLAAFGSSEYRKNKRLMEEYAHKEVLAKSYQGYKKEFTEKGDETASENLDESLINTLDENPSRILGTNSSSDRPKLTDVLERSE
ncbi:hypothetical protein SAMN04487967_2948 [Natronorubrum sediminis]|uniref:Uncharacterized protein n=1 Tax=Natronorubrum sediminis TaxID=640943 RepID=A0A1H6G5A9_9EURY|nr:hypothetical protein [Natronorubrum sediminis]SEH17055.1 hypothetical protein SAMN04487967_2948 [Natronorubrum sediminis]